MRSISSRSTTALDADRGASFADHCRNFGLPPVKLPVAIPVAVDGAAEDGRRRAGRAGGSEPDPAESCLVASMSPGQVGTLVSAKLRTKRHRMQLSAPTGRPVEIRGRQSLGVSPSNTYTGDPHLGLTTREAFLGWKSNQEVQCAVESGVRVFCRS